MGRLRNCIERRPVACACRQARHDLLRAVRPLQTSPRHLGGESRTAGRPRGKKDRRICAQCSNGNHCPPGSYPARFGTHLRAHRRQHFSRRLESRAIIFQSPGCRMVPVPNAHRWTLPLRRRSTSRRRRHWSSRPQLGSPGSAGFEKRQVQRGRSMSTNGIPNTADFIILGAGVMGASIAFHLAGRKAGRIAVLDKDHAGSGASGRSSALVRLHYSFPPEVHLALISLKVFQHWRDIVGEPGEFRKTGFVRIVHPSGSEALKQNVAMQKKLGANVELIDRHQLTRLEPDWQVDDVELAAYEPDSGYGDGNVVANDFLTCARDSGVTYLSKTRATSFLIEAGRIRGVATHHGAVYAPVVIAATGPWTRPLFQSTGFDPLIE